MTTSKPRRHREERPLVMPPPNAQTLSRREAMALSGLGKTKLDELIQGGHIPSRLIGRRRLIRRADLEKFLDPRSPSVGQ